MIVLFITNKLNIYIFIYPFYVKELKTWNVQLKIFYSLAAIVINV